MKYKWIIPILGVLMGIGLITYTLWDIQDQEDKYDRQIEALLNENQDLSSANYILDSTITRLQHKADSLVFLIDDLKKNTVILKQKRDAKSIRITGFSNDELYKYFTKFNTEKDTVR